MYFVGIDIGSTAAKTLVLKDQEPEAFLSFVLPTGWSSKETSARIRQRLLENGIDVAAEDTRVTATGYGRVAVCFADKTVTEITCHGKGGAYWFGSETVTIIDVGGQDTKVITVEGGNVTRFLMNDKCSAGTGKFLEVMANRLGVDLSELFELAQQGNPISISAMCTVFAESEVISHIGEGTARADIAAGVVDSVANKVISLVNRHGAEGKCVLTGGLSTTAYFVDVLSQKLGQPIAAHPLGKFAGALGAALIAGKGYR